DPGRAGPRGARLAPARDAQHRRDPGRDRRGAEARGRLCGRAGGQRGLRGRQADPRAGVRGGDAMTDTITTIGDIVRGEREIFPPYLYAAYQSTRRRAPSLALIDVPLTLSELTGPGPAVSAVLAEDADLTRNAGTGGEAIGQRIIVTGRVLDQSGRPVPNTLVEVWQANAS